MMKTDKVIYSSSHMFTFWPKNFQIMLYVLYKNIIHEQE